MDQFSALERIERMIGASEYKKQMRELAAIIPQVVERNIPNTLFYRNYIFSIDKGCGLSTCLDNMKALVEEAGISEVSVRESTLPSDLSGYYDPKNPFSSQRYRIECIDIGEWISKTDHPSFKSYLHFLQKSADTTIFVFRLPLTEDDLLKKVHACISDVLIVSDVKFSSLTREEMRKFADMKAEEMGFSFGEDAYEAFDGKINDEKRDGRFYGFDTVNKVVQEIVFSKLVSNASGQSEGSVITKDDIGKGNSEQTEEDPLSKFDSYIGLESVKRQVSEIVEQIKYLHARENVKMPCIHMRFVGNPGTGKTTAARIIGEVLAEEGVLRSGGFFEYFGRDFIGKYIGETAQKTSEICRAAYGSVLFIDEAYSLYFSENDERDFGREALSTLISEMENHRSDMVVIMAGYPDEMDTLMKGNKGLEGRMPYLIEFGNYSREQLSCIFMKMAREEFTVSDGLDAAVSDYFASLPDSFVNSKKFGNARFARNLYERTQKKALNRCLREGCDVVITEDDLKNAAKEPEFDMASEKHAAQIGF